MKPATLKYIEITIGISVVASILYLYGWGLPADLAIVRFAAKGQLGGGLIQIPKADEVQEIAIVTLAQGWSGVRVLWPQLLAAFTIIQGLVLFVGVKILKLVYANAKKKSKNFERSANEKLEGCRIIAKRMNMDVDELLTKHRSVFCVTLEPYPEIDKT